MAAFSRAVGAAAIVIASVCAPALAEELSGTWLRENGASQVRFAPCGKLQCGTVVWLREPKFDIHNEDPQRHRQSIMGKRVYFDIEREDDTSWSAAAYNPDDGKTYSGRMRLADGLLYTTGCVLGGLICSTVKWTRVK